MLQRKKLLYGAGTLCLLGLLYCGSKSLHNNSITNATYLSDLAVTNEVSVTSGPSITSGPGVTSASSITEAPTSTTGAATVTPSITSNPVTLAPHVTSGSGTTTPVTTSGPSTTSTSAVITTPVSTSGASVTVIPDSTLVPETSTPNTTSGSAATPSPSASVAPAKTAKPTKAPASTKKPTATVKPTATPKISISWKKKTKTLKAGKSYTFKVQNNNKKIVAANKIKWTVSNKKYATITQKGTLTGKQVGTVTLKATYAKKTISCKIKITPKKIIGIDAGHQQYGNSGLEPIGPGASTKKPKVAGGTRGVATGIAEYQLNLTIAKSLKKELISRGYSVVMTRTTHNVNITNKERAIKINKSGADICVRIHADGGASSARGACGLYPSPRNPYISKLSKKSLKLSSCVLNSYCKATGIKNRGNVQRDDLTGTNWSTVPVIVLELGFMTNPTEDRYMSSTNGQKTMVKGIADGIDLYYK